MTTAQSQTLPLFFFFALPHLLHVLVHYVCSTLHSAASSVKRLETRTLVAHSLSLSFAALPLSRCSCALWIIAYGWRRRSRRTYLLFVVVMICDFHAAAAPLALFSHSLPDYRWPHGSRRRAQLRHLLEFHSTCLRVSLGLSSLSLSQSLPRLPSPLPSPSLPLCECECDDARLRPFCDFNSFVLFQFCEPRIANEQNV